MNDRGGEDKETEVSVTVLEAREEDELEGYELLEVALGAGAARVVVRRRNLDAPEPVPDAFFFEDDYTLAGSTGFSIWDASWVLLALLGRLAVINAEDALRLVGKGRQCTRRKSTSESCLQSSAMPSEGAPVIAMQIDPQALRSIDLGGGTSGSEGDMFRQFLAQIVSPADRCDRREKQHSVLELGSGTGVTGLALAALGARVVMTDIRSVVCGSLLPNVHINAVPDASTSNSSFKSGTCAAAHDRNAAAEGVWARIGARGGECMAMALDWRESASWDAATLEVIRSCRCILAVETVWLPELVSPLIDSLLRMMDEMDAAARSDAATTLDADNIPQSDADQRASAVAWLLFSQRATEGSSALFVTPATLLSRLRAAGCFVRAAPPLLPLALSARALPLLAYQVSRH